MHGTIKAGQIDPLAMLIYRLEQAVVLRLERELARGLAVGGDGWRLDRVGLSIGRSPAEVQLPLVEITAVEQFDGKLCVWRRGQDEAAARLSPGGKNVNVLPALLATRIAPHEGSSAQSPAGLGRILFQRRPHSGVVLGFLI